MGKTAKRPVQVSDESGVPHRFEAGEEVPDELAARIDNPAVWEDPEPGSTGPDPTELNATATVSTEPPVSLAVHDAPYASPPAERVEGVVNQAGTGLEGEGQEETRPDGVSSDEQERAGVKPSPGDLDGMTHKELVEVATKLDVAVPSGASKAQIRQLIDSAPDRPRGEGD